MAKYKTNDSWKKLKNVSHGVLQLLENEDNIEKIHKEKRPYNPANQKPKYKKHTTG